ncbi:VOC family protein [Flocculibacter collagenilyticus]|uniref:VOC family protein n=1 Tax=Flocculibacter collagenilyticus TaxID=2744479 RepID=UPI0018F3260D|nr:VOC family protein [Flocculibacter collagenilyticus]
MSETNARRRGAIDYIELPSNDLTKSESFFSELFGWTFQSYSPEYLAFNDGHTDGGFYVSDLKANTENGSALVVFYHEDLENLCKQVTNLGGSIKKEIFSFPGGRRFHFTDLTGNEYAVWSDK